ncbi:flagellar protein FlaG [Deefgea piscis]|uniref:flagellar protein FlaG n=1 Tax=Deefgea piscis TaxID=2739061 RepID=UPI001C8235DC|nr:flagellar protein FlaG [Deefgea piscis]QZA80030.1 flagellar protein FlaG [Deefgea piscis]
MQIQSNLAAQSLIVPAMKVATTDAAVAQSAQQTTVSNSAASTTVGAASPSDPQLLNQSVEKLNNMVQGLANGLQFSVDEESKVPVVKLVDLDTKEVIRQIPTEEAISIAQAIDRFQGLLVKEKA